MAQNPSNTPIRIDIQAILDGISLLDNTALESFAEKVRTLIAQRRSPYLTKEETELITKINQGLPEKVQNQYVNLLQRSESGTLTKEEHLEFLELIPLVEEQNAERLKSLIDLSQLWNKSVDDVMKKLNIEPQPYG